MAKCSKANLFYAAIQIKNDLQLDNIGRETLYYQLKTIFYFYNPSQKRLKEESEGTFNRC